jgi:hypothetical protein
VSLKTSIHPLVEDNKPVIHNFLNRLNSHGLEAITNGIISPIFEKYKEVMSTLNKSLKPNFEDEEKVSVSIKVLNRGLPPDTWNSKTWS